MGSRRRCWREYLKFCLIRNTIFFPEKYNWRARADFMSCIAKAIENDTNANHFADISFKEEVKVKPRRMDTQIPPPQPPVPATPIKASPGLTISFAEAVKRNMPKQNTSKSMNY